MTHLLAPRLVFAVAGRVAPASRDLTPAARADFLRLIDRVLAPRRPLEVLQLRLFLHVVRWLPLLRYGRPFESLTPARQDDFLGWLERAPAPLLRQGFWGLKTLIFLGQYGRPEAGAAAGYAPSWEGNERLHDRT